MPRSQRQRTLSQERAAQGLCVACGALHTGPPKKCRPCTVKASEAMWRWKQGRQKEKPSPVRGWNFDTDNLITEHVHLAKRMAYRLASRQYSSSTVDVGDLVGDALYGLVVAGRTYDESYQVPFPQWAATQIRGAMHDGMRRWYSRTTPRPVLVPLEDEDADTP